MTTPSDSPRARLMQLMQARVDSAQPMPWETRERRLAGVPRSGSTGKWYSGITPWLLWAEAEEAGLQSAVWHTARSAEDGVPEGATGIKVGSAVVYSADQLGMRWPKSPDDGAVAAQRVQNLVSFIGVPISAEGDTGYDLATGAIRIAGVEAFDTPAQRAATVLELLVLWTRDEERLDRDDDSLEPLIGHLGGTLLSAAFRVPDNSRLPVDWAAALADEKRLRDAMNSAERAAQYIQDLARPELRSELARLDTKGRAARAAGAGFAVEMVTSLGQALRMNEDELRPDPEEDEEEDRRQEPLVLAEGPGEVLHTFLTHFGHDEPSGRKNPPLCAWLAGGAGTGRNQVVSALNALFRTGGTDLTGALVATEGVEDLLGKIEEVWSDERLMVLPCTMPRRVQVTHDRAIPTAALRAFHIAYGLSPHLWVARMEHRLLRSGEYAAFVAAFEERTGRKWQGAGHRNPEAHREAIIQALGGAAAGARRRLTHYERTRQSASWKALEDEAGWSLFHLKPGEFEPAKKALPDARERRVLFVLDLASALVSDDPSAHGWLRRALSGVPSRMAEMARPSHRPMWFLMTPNTSLKELAELVKWKSEVRRKQINIDLDQSPVTAAVGGDLLRKDPAACRPIYAFYARHSDTLYKLAVLEGMRIPQPRERDALLATYPFLPSVLAAAQAILDTFAGEAKAIPLTRLVRMALDEQYYAPPERLVPLDVLLGPQAELLETGQSASAAVGSARIMVAAAPAVAVQIRNVAFPADTVLQTVRWANRIRGFPCTAPNLVRLMVIRLDRDLDVLEAEVADTLDDLATRGHLRKMDNVQVYRWVRGI